MLSQADGTRYKYDVEGNLTEKRLPKGQGSWHYQWDSAGQLVRLKRPDGYAVQFHYDALGRRTHKLFRGKLTRWVWDGDTPLHEWSEYTVGTEAGSVEEVITWLFEPDSFAPLARLTPSQRLSVVADHLGTPLELVDEQGSVAWGAQLDSYGRIRQGTGRAGLCPFRYQGQYEDTETGLYYNRFRYYSPQEGMYISQDPIGLEGGFELYSYAENPNASIDPSGLYNGKGKRKLGKYHAHHKAQLDPADYTKKDDYHFAKGNQSIHERMQRSPKYAAMMEKKYPGITEHVAPGKRGGFSPDPPPGLTWHHNNNPGQLDLVDRNDHKTFHKVYHPDGGGGRNKWGGGTVCR